MSPAAAEAATQRPGNPWWIPPILGRVPPEVDARQLSLIGAVALAIYFEGYDITMAAQAIKYIREDFGFPQSEIGRVSAWFRLGAIPAFFLIPFGDGFGRRRVFLLCIVGSSLATFATAFTQSIEQFILVQIFARTFLITGVAQAYVIVAEEVPAAHRGWSIGILGAFSALGVGLGALLFSMIEWLPYGWRSLYVVGVVPLALMPYFRARVRETARFTRERATGARAAFALGEWIGPIVALSTRHPVRTLCVIGIAAFSSAATGPVHALAADYVLTDHGWAPWEFSLMYLTGGVVGVIGNTLTGRLGDRFGRRIVGCAIFATMPLFGLAFYNGGSAWLLIVAWPLLAFTTTGGSMIVRALATELFPTSSRGTATGVLLLVETLAAAAALWLITWFTPMGTSIAVAVRAVVFVSAAAAVLALCLPETARRDLEDISGGGGSG